MEVILCILLIVIVLFFLFKREGSRPSSTKDHPRREVAGAKEIITRLNRTEQYRMLNSPNRFTMINQIRSYLNNQNLATESTINFYIDENVYEKSVSQQTKSTVLWVLKTLTSSTFNDSDSKIALTSDLDYLDLSIKNVAFIHESFLGNDQLQKAFQMIEQSDGEFQLNGDVFMLSIPLQAKPALSIE